MKVMVLGKATERSESGEFGTAGRFVEARAEFERAAELTSNEAERAHLLARASRS